jgi:hypothetical protein
MEVLQVCFSYRIAATKQVAISALKVPLPVAAIVARGRTGIERHKHRQEWQEYPYFADKDGPAPKG